MSNSLPKPRTAYNHDLFVNRTDEISPILAKAHGMMSDLDRRRVIVFNAPRGAGKSWLLQEIAWRLRSESSFRAVYLDLLRYVEQPPDKAIRDVIADLSQEAGFQVESSIYDIVNSMVGALQIFVLLVDPVDESSNGFLELLEDHCLVPLTTQMRALIVLAGLGREYIWKSPSLRYASSYDLVPFTYQDTQEQLQRQVPSAATQANAIQQLSGGYPWANYLYGQKMSPDVPNPPDVIDTLLGDWKSCRPQLEALCVLRAFDESRIQVLFEICFKDPPRDYAACRKVREMLVATSLVRWEDSKRGYIIDEAIRPILENDLFKQNRTRWRLLHQASAELYASWAAKYPKSKADWEQEAAYHFEKLKAAGY